ncbi:MAG: hypothetical protein WD027_00410 [Gaiellales bacterium]
MRALGVAEEVVDRDDAPVDDAVVEVLERAGDRAEEVGVDVEEAEAPLRLERWEHVLEEALHRLDRVGDSVECGGEPERPQQILPAAARRPVLRGREVRVVLVRVRRRQAAEAVDAHDLLVEAVFLRQEGEEEGHAAHPDAGLDDVAGKLSATLPKDAGVEPVAPRVWREHADRSHRLDQAADVAREALLSKDAERKGREPTLVDDRVRCRVHRSLE